MALALVVVSFSWWCSTLDGRVSVNERDIVQNTVRIDKNHDKLSTDISSLDKTLQILAINQAKMDIQYVQIREALTEIKNTLDKWGPNNEQDSTETKR